MRSWERGSADHAVPILKRILAALRGHFSNAEIRIRADAGFCSPKVFDFLDTQPHLRYAIGIGKNPILKGKIEPKMERVRGQADRSGTSCRVYGSFRYARNLVPKAAHHLQGRSDQPCGWNQVRGCAGSDSDPAPHQDRRPGCCIRAARTQSRRQVRFNHPRPSRIFGPVRCYVRARSSSTVFFRRKTSSTKARGGRSG